MVRIARALARRALEEPDRTAATVCAIAAVPLTIWLALSVGVATYLLAGLLPLLACVGYLFIRKAWFQNREPEPEPAVHLLSNVVFFAAFVCSVLLLYLRPETYVRPTGYFICTALMAAALGVEILFLQPRRTTVLFSLFKIVLLYLSLVWSQLLLYPSIVGVDPWWHRWFTLDMLVTGHAPPETPYSLIPGMHFLVGGTSLVTGLDYKWSAMLSVGLVHIIFGTMMVFLIGRLAHSIKAGLLAALMIAVANWNLAFAYWTIPNTMAVALILVVIYLLFKVRAGHPKPALILALLGMAALLVTHSMATFFLIILLFVYWLGTTVYGFLYQRANGESGATLPKSGNPRANGRASPVPLYLAIVFAAASFAWWNYTGHLGFLNVHLETGIGESPFVTMASPLLRETVSRYIANLPVTEQLFNHSGHLLFFALSFVGIFYLMARRPGARDGLVIATGGFVLLAIAFFSESTDTWIISGRWFFTSQVLLAVPLGVALILISGLPSSRVGKAVVLSVLVCGLSFAMTMSYRANLDNRVFCPGTGIRYAFTESETRATAATLDIWNERITTDSYYGGRLVTMAAEDSPAPNVDSLAMNEQLVLRSFAQNRDALAVVREEIVEHAFVVTGGILKLDYDPRSTLETQGYSQIYDCGSVNSFVWGGD